MSHKRFPRVSRLRKGYHRRQVDAFLSSVEVALGGALPPPTAAEIRQVGFEMVHGGYDPGAVDRALDTLEERVIAAHAMTAGRRGRFDPDGEAEVLCRELAAPYMQRFPRTRTLHRGYDVDDVDEFVDQVLTALRGEATVTAEQVRGAAFRPRRGGYREDVVDETLDRVVEHLLLVRRQTTGNPPIQPTA
jgi:DivIVA domain-containing protein